MARVVNQLIPVTLSGDMMVNQYSGTGPKVVKFGDRGDVSVASGDYVLYDKEEVVGVVAGKTLDALRSDKDSLDPPIEPTGGDVTAVVLNAGGTPLPYEPVFLKQDDVPIATGVTDQAGSVTFNVLPGVYKIGPQDASHGPDIEVTGTPGPSAADKAAAAASQGTGSSGGTSTQRYDVMGNPDPNGQYDAHGALLPTT
jgi:hypothetical protein